MNAIVKLALGLSLCAVACDDSLSAPDAPPTALLGSIEVTALDNPVPVLAEGEAQVVYEVDLFNPADNVTVRMAGLTITNGSDLVASYSAGELEQMLSFQDLDVAPAMGRIVYLWLSFPSDQVPASLINTLAFQGTDETRTVTVDISNQSPITVATPLAGDGWLAAAIGNGSHHRRAVFATPEVRRIPQRFAIDWAKIDEQGEVFSGDPLQNTSYFGYGEPVLAVADGRIVEVLDGIPDNVPGTRAIEITSDNIRGNAVTLELADGTEAYYAHLIPGSLRVAAGDYVQVGDTLGLLGNSGNSDFAHLHIHVARVYDHADSGANADGLPFVFESFEIRANRPVLGMRFEEMPLNEAVIRFN